MKLILLGHPGSGKGTVAEFLIKKYKLPVISTGDLLRGAVESKGSIGKKLKQYMEKGKLVPNQLVEKLIKQRLTKLKGHSHILDGFPRNIKQAKFLGNIDPINKVFYLKVPDDVIVKRLGGRRICEKCNIVYHIKNIPPKKQGICDKCGSKLIKREDDNPRVIKKRLRVYKKTTAPLINYYQKRKLLVTINANQKLKKIFNDVLSALK